MHAEARLELEIVKSEKGEEGTGGGGESVTSSAAYKEMQTQAARLKEVSVTACIHTHA